ncbi:D-galacturonate reductase-like [Arachis stenosperma]|uniref:D-galacturonate reductase-like n=1 Tax=Arachis stenosperma TaxID=217475 RepID=UPI0025AD294F|nr:D-galacturonate reductase-like [Arachis stenosperma]
MLVIGFGTTAFETDDGDVHKLAVMEAIELGYGQFDTASIYGSEQALGEAIVEAVKLGLISSMDELFITSMLCGSSLVLLLLALTACYPSLVVVNSSKAHEQLKAVLLTLLDKFPFDMPILLLGTSSVVLAEVEDVLHSVFSHRSMYF